MRHGGWPTSSSSTVFALGAHRLKDTPWSTTWGPCRLFWILPTSLFNTSSRSASSQEEGTPLFKLNPSITKKATNRKRPLRLQDGSCSSSATLRERFFVRVQLMAF